MMMQIRKLMSEDVGMLRGIVEVDETYIGGKGWNRGKKWWDNWEERPKQILMGMVERNGRVTTRHIPNTGATNLINAIKETVDPRALVMTDKLYGYRALPKHGYAHKSVNHSKQYVVDGDTYTQNIENFWSHIKSGITGVYRHVSKKYLQFYANEFAFRYNYRREPERMFGAILNRTISLSE